MIEHTQIKKFCNQIVQQFRPDQIILFGSYGYGQPTEESDVDLLVVLSFEGENARKSWEILRQTNPSFPVDLLIRTPKKIQERLNLNDGFIREIIEKGQVLYAADHSRVD